MGFKVIIVGGSVAGLTLANILERLGVDFTLLEAYPEIAPQVGASIGLLPNGFRILDQIQCYEPIREIAGDFYLQASYRDANGKATTTPSSGVTHHLEARYVAHTSKKIQRSGYLGCLAYGRKGLGIPQSSSIDRCSFKFFMTTSSRRTK